MASVMVRMYATLRSVSRTDRLNVNASTLTDVDRELRKRYGDEMARVLGQADHPLEGVVVLVNGVNVPREQLSTVNLNDGDEIAIFPPISGG